MVGIPGKPSDGMSLLPSLLTNAFLKQSGIELSSFASRTLTPPQREALIKKAAVIFDVNPIVVRIRLDSLFPQKKIDKYTSTTYFVMQAMKAFYAYIHFRSHEDILLRLYEKGGSRGSRCEYIG